MSGKKEHIKDVVKVEVDKNGKAKSKVDKQRLDKEMEKVAEKLVMRNIKSVKVSKS